MKFFRMSTEEVVKELNSSVENGLTTAEANARLEKNGKNELKEKKKKSLLLRFLAQFKDLMIIILIIAAVISLFVGEHGLGYNAEGAMDAAIIFLVILVNAILGVVQEARAEKALDALKKLSAPYAKVIRDGVRHSVLSSELVVGDIILLEAGDLVPADARILEAANLKVEESSLTGESVPVDKQTLVINSDEVMLGDMKNMLFTTGTVTYGRGKAIVTTTGMDTEVGKIADLLQNEKDEITPLQIKLEQLGKMLGIVALAICAVIFAVGVLEGKPVFEMFLTAVSLAVAAIPEGLPAIVTIVLAIGVQKLVKANAIIRKLPAVETLGSASVICSDKTGTLTQNRMTVVKLYENGEINELNKESFEKNKKLLEYGAMCNDGSVKIEDGKEKHIGDPTETALVAAALKAGIEKEKLEYVYPRIEELPFDSERKLMTTIHQIEGKIIAVVKGAPDVLLARCKSFDGLEKAQKANEIMGKAALRVLAVGVRVFDSLPKEITNEFIENDLDFVGLIGMIDPPREEVKDAVALCRSAGIRPVMITGDHIETAMAIAKELGIMREGDKSISGNELAKMSDEELFKRIKEFAVYARVSPEHKIKIVNAWQKAGEVVAMTGDGVNDAPALKGADIGCAMGITGTDVSKSAAHMVLTDDNFATIVVAVKEGRGIYENILRAVQFLLSSNIGEILTIFTAIILKWAVPLLPIHLLWVNLVTDSLPAVALGMEPVDKSIMKEKPRKKNENIFANGFGLTIFLQGFMIGALALIGFIIGKMQSGTSFTENLDPDIGVTMAFAVLSISQLFHSFNIKSKYSILTKGIFSNMYLVYAFIAGLALQLGVMLIPAFRTIFKLAELNIEQWLIVFGLAFMPIVIVEIAKFIQSKFKK
jgi:Ca2+-transporting ATPase